MRIVFILPQEGTQPIGGFKVVYEYANGLARRGHTVHVAHMASAFPKGAHRRPKELLHVFRYFPFALKGNWKPDKWFALDPAVEISWIPGLSRIFLPKADAYIATWWVTAEHLSRIRHLPGKPFYLIQHLETWSGPEEQVMATWKMPLEKIVIARWLEKIGADIGEPSHYIPNGLDFTKFGCDVSFETREPARIAMLFNNRIGWKGSADGLAATLRLKNRYPQLQAEFFGVYERPADMPSWITYHKEPAQDELRRIYNRAAIFLAPSHSEGWGLPPAEAMTCGAAVVATDIGGHQEFCRKEETALLVPAKCPEKLANAAGKLIDDQTLRIRLAKNGHDNIHKFTWSAATDAFENVLLSHI
jgi:glycosyltransferase involved in cell wall biosynthesis